MEKKIKDWFEPVLAKYRLKPEYIESFGKVHKIVTRNGTYALKVLRNPKQMEFIHLFRQLYQKGYTKIVPIIKTIDGQFFATYHNQLFYLMPWFQNHLNDERSVHQNRMLRELARLHFVTAQKIPIKKEELLKTYENVSNDWNQKISFLEEYIDNCEKKWYMSPFELQSCTIFHETMQAGQFALDHHKKWYDLANNKENARIVVNHGNISCQHFAYDQNESGHFISFDHANYAVPVYDLIRYYHRVLRTYPIECHECKDWYNHYQKYFPYTEEEKELFLSYLVFPEQVYRTIKNYMKDQQKNEREYVNQLQKDYWQMKNIEYVVMSIHEQTEASPEQEEGATS